MQQEITVSISDLLRFIWRGLILALLVAGVAGFLVYRYSQSREPVYQATATVLVSQPQRIATDFVAAPLDDIAYREAALSDPVLEQTLRALNPELTEVTQSNIRRLRGSTSVRTTLGRTTSLLYLTVAANTGQGAANAATALARELVGWDRERSQGNIDASILGVEAQIESLQQQIRAGQATGQPDSQLQPLQALLSERITTLNNLRSLRDATSTALMVLQPASAPGAPVQPRPMFDATLAALLGLVLTYALLLLRSALDTSLKSVDDIAQVSGLPVLAEFPRLARGVRSLPREASSYLRTNLLFSTSEETPKVILVTSATSEEGKSSIAINLAESFVRNGYRTLLIDADLRKPIIASEYRINNIHQASLEDCLKNPYQAHRAATVSIGAKDYLYVMPTFQPTPQASELLSRGFRECLDRWRQEYDVIVVDSAPVLAVADALAIAPLSTGTLLAVNMQKVDRRQLRNVVELLRRIGVRLLGVAVTHVNREGQQGTYGYGYGDAEAVRTQGAPLEPPKAQASVRDKTR
jgi:polysaccharide biosynthesis transport protein